MRVPHFVAPGRIDRRPRTGDDHQYQLCALARRRCRAGATIPLLACRALSSFCLHAFGHGLTLSHLQIPADPELHDSVRNLSSYSIRETLITAFHSSCPLLRMLLHPHRARSTPPSCMPPPTASVRYERAVSRWRAALTECCAADSSQGRIDRNFADDNDTLIDDLVAKNPDCSSLEVRALPQQPCPTAPHALNLTYPCPCPARNSPVQMETAHLFHLASISCPSSTPSRIRAAACHMVFAGRRGDGTGDFIDPDVVADLEPKIGRACLDAIIGWKVEREHPPAGTVWEL